MLELILIRHGETEGNRKRIYQGWTDTKLNEKGLRQAERLALRLRDKELDYIYSSPLERALATALAVNRYHGLDIKKVDNIKEIHFGDWENMSRQQLEELYPDYMKKWRKDYSDFTAPGGESLEAAYSRINWWLEKLIKNNRKGSILIASHAGAIRAMVSGLVGRGVEGHWNYIISNCSITTINVFDGFPVLAGLNDVSHLKDL
ncbi:MAG: histidine phosphatase family protein [Clostridia bacterium]|nr:histidine phosphatase family protein [Clostridiales bacterium]